MLIPFQPNVNWIFFYLSLCRDKQRGVSFTMFFFISDGLGNVKIDDGMVDKKIFKDKVKS